MNVTVDKRGGSEVAVVHGDEILLTDAAAALELLMNVKHYTGCDRMIVSKAAVHEDFFELKTGLAGTMLQKFINYRMRLAIYGDFNVYNSKSLSDFIRESNQGAAILFPSSKKEALDRMHKMG